MNPEFRRNLWLEFTPQRLVIMPIILGLVFFAVGQVEDHRGEIMSSVAQYAFFLIVLLWGCFRAAASLGEEMREATWDSQRMSALGPWAMSWGKLLGATSFVWYGGLFCLAAIVLGFWNAGNLDSLYLQTAKLVVVGLLGQIVSFGVALSWLRKTRPTRRLPTGFCLAMGILAAYLVTTLDTFSLTSELRIPGGDIQWFSWSMSLEWFNFVSLIIFTAWALLGVYRLMQAELQVKQRPWAWFAFTLYSMVFAVGLADGANWDCDRSSIGLVLLPLAYSVALFLCYLIVFLDAKDTVRWRALLAQGRTRAWRAALAVTPSWLVALVLVIVVGGLSLLAPVTGLSSPGWPDCGVAVDLNPEGIRWLLLGSLAFLVRDVCLILALNLGRWRHRADQAAVIYLALLYGLVPFALEAAGWDGAAGLFYPTGLWDGGGISAASGLVQAALALAFLVWYWRALEAGFRRNLALDAQ